MTGTQIPVVDVDIHSDVVVPCPAKRFQPRRAANACPGCDYFQGVGQMVVQQAGEEPLQWHQKYVIRCAHVIERRTQMFNVIED